MMMADSKKKASTLILKKLVDGSEEASEAPSIDGIEQDSSLGQDSAAEEILQAIESKDAAALKSAIRSMVQMCMDEAPEAE
jgi:hypothetical protein